MIIIGVNSKQLDLKHKNYEFCIFILVLAVGLVSLLFGCLH